jgi:deoxyribonuclease (pyrimidine dimer)
MIDHQHQAEFNVLLDPTLKVAPMRINIVPVTELTDQHLGAEYLEIQLACGALQRTLRSKRGFVPNKVPPRFTLNHGHIYFFFNKGAYLERRYNAIRAECAARGRKTLIDFPAHVWPAELFNSWLPSPADYIPIRVRIAQRVLLKPPWYKFWSRPLTPLKILSYKSYLEDHCHDPATPTILSY